MILVILVSTVSHLLINYAYIHVCANIHHVNNKPVRMNLISNYFQPATREHNEVHNGRRHDDVQYNFEKNCTYNE